MNVFGPTNQRMPATFELLSSSACNFDESELLFSDNGLKV